MKNTWFTPEKKQERIEAKIKLYRESITSITLKNAIDDMGMTQETLDILESAMDSIVDSCEGDSQREKYTNALSNIKIAERMLEENKKEEN